MNQLILREEQYPIKSLEHLKFVRKAGHEYGCYNPDCAYTAVWMYDKKCVHPHHLRALGKEKRQLPNPKHFLTVPLCPDCHREVHNIGLIEFNKRYDIDLGLEAAKLLVRHITMIPEQPEGSFL